MGKLLQTKGMAKQISEHLVLEVKRMKEKGIDPTIAVLIVQGDPASECYAKAKQRIARKLGIRYLLTSVHPQITETELLAKIKWLNRCPSIHGIILELPLPKHLDAKKMVSAIAPEKDVDGLSPANKLACFTGDDGLYPATPQSCIRILDYFGYPLKGKNVVLIGCGETVGKPLVHLLLRANATLTICHEYTNNLQKQIEKADILISAVGKANLVTTDMVHRDLVIVDAGINELKGGIVGDVQPEVLEIVQAATPVPGGVGKVTTMILFENLLKAVRLQITKSQEEVRQRESL
ncbi:MAG: tetrahydrofolate dehydrogenase/cyclohydrolase catalytic domain-containing protein [Sporolactobacillus sp.]|uniref:bifunctional 5,10-methylenetetrahydrofolate dehydrogenase/5,10-methenyltetrahydrofolate cyclohydrolase n=1 Tax=Sporolactobacillus sp. STSJ-5 TaxID=2965076 RepID=UPI002103C5BD|nr:tetrahydrofolate dehydrogenase/cyclohydrolase catalytic domain-containing protein [Sporolactobacillus sp. STSJ-5]MCQ2009139.1 bifunctional 5,10-methylene-tetrahydrofolate dehydrogenase/5,10-methylene-tetrahydrofolate cyclohydrolase [Sporolactobacillus sp. STSJ-5]